MHVIIVLSNPPFFPSHASGSQPTLPHPGELPAVTHVPIFKMTPGRRVVAWAVFAKKLYTALLKTSIDILDKKTFAFLSGSADYCVTFKAEKEKSIVIMSKKVSLICVNLIKGV